MKNVRLLYKARNKAVEPAISSVIVALLCAGIAVLYPPLIRNITYLVVACLSVIGSFALRMRVMRTALRRESTYVLAIYMAISLVAFVFVVI